MQKKRGDGLGALTATGLMVVVASASFPLYHAVMECLFLVAATLVYIFTMLTHAYHRSSFLRIIGVGFLSAALLSFLHLASQNGFLPGVSNAMAYELAAGIVLGVSVILAVAFMGLENGFVWAGWTLAIIQLGMLLAILGERYPIDLVYNGGGISRGDLILPSIQGVSAILLWARKKAVQPRVYRCVQVGIAFFVLSAISQGYSGSLLWGMVGHAAKVSGAFVIVCGVVYLGIKSPLNQLFFELKSDAVSDSLTGLYNRQGLQEMASKEVRAADRRRSSLGLLVMDLDNFKEVNDRFGHITGDDILKHFGRILRMTVGPRGVPFRLGGDEFLVIVRDGSQDNMTAVEERIRRAFYRWIGSHAVAGILGLSIGAAVREPRQGEDLERFIHEADANMYREKRGSGRRTLLKHIP